MIKRAGEKDLTRIIDYLLFEGSLNTTFFAHIEKYGFEKDFQNIWIYSDEARNEILAVIMRHFSSLYIYSKGFSIDIEELASFISFLGPDIISGKRDVLSELALAIDGMVLEPSKHMVLMDNDGLIHCEDVKKAKLDDCAELAELIFSIPEFSRFYHSQQEIERGIRRRMELGICRYYVLKRDGIIASQAYTTIESKNFAIIGGVVTRNEYRKQGLASLVVSGISQEIINEKKKPNLFYSNERAGRVYERLGFVSDCDYAMLLNHRYFCR